MDEEVLAKRKSKNSKVSNGCTIYVLILLLVVLLNVIAWNSTAFCDAYIKYLFPVWVNTYGRFMNLFPFSVGEIMLFLGVLLTAVFIVVAVYSAVRLVIGRVFTGNVHGKEAGNSCSCVGIFSRRYMIFVMWLLLGIFLVMTLNCTILYHASTFSEKYFGEAREEYSVEELIRVRNLVVDKCNQLSQQMTRDEKGEIVYTEDIRKAAVKAMQELGKEYDQLDGYYPYPKPLLTSDFFSQQYMLGYYFPFSMEANYNDVAYVMNLHSTMCHELAHLRGYIFEDEANFISYLACVQSEDPVVQYSGYLSVLNYLDNDFYKAVGKDREAYLSQPVISDQVHEDNAFLTEEEWERIESKAWLDTEMVDEVSDVFTETTLKVNGVSDGMISYTRVVKLLLQYYEVQGLFEDSF